jgi:hypothetical protein
MWRHYFGWKASWDLNPDLYSLTLDSRRKCGIWVKPTCQRGVLAVPRLCVFKIDSMILISETECVYCAVRPGSLVKTDYISSLKDMSWSRRTVAGISLRIWGSIPGQTMWDSWRTGGRPFPEYFGFPLSVSFHHCSILVFIHALLLPEEQNGRILGNLHKNTTLLPNSGNIG